MRTIEITEANEWKQTLTDVAQSIQDKWAILGEQSEWDKRVYNEVVEIQKKLEIIEFEAKYHHTPEEWGRIRKFANDQFQRGVDSIIRSEAKEVKSAEEILQDFRKFFNERYFKCEEAWKIEILYIDVMDFLKSTQINLK
jgi:hypothetical protein